MNHRNRIQTGIRAAFLFFLLFNSNSLAARQVEWHVSTEKEEKPLFTEQFSSEEFSARREKVYKAIGENAIAIIQGASTPPGYQPFRQNNEFFYLSGIESPDAYLLLDGRKKEATVYLYNRKSRREYGEGKILSFEDADLIKKLSGIENVGSYESLILDLKAYDNSENINGLYTHFSPYEGLGMTRGMAKRSHQDKVENPLDSRPSRVQNFIAELKKVAPTLKLQNLDPIVDEMRKIKSENEIEAIRKSSDLQAEAIMEAMRSTKAGIKPFHLDAVAKYIYLYHNTQGDAYYPLIHFGPDAYMNHYHSSVRTARSGDMILMDYGVYTNYYSSDLARMWPVSGTFNAVQRELYSFYKEFYEAILYQIKGGLTPYQVMQNALVEIDSMLEKTEFSDELYKKAAHNFVDSYKNRLKRQGFSLGHGVGMAAHDPGNYSDTLRAGMIFTIEPQFRVPEKNIYIRLEDMILITENGAEIMSEHLPRDIKSIEAIIAEEGLLQKYPVMIKSKHN